MGEKATENQNCKKRYQNGNKIPNDHELHQDFPCQGPPKYSQIGIFGLKIYHLATLLSVEADGCGKRFLCLAFLLCDLFVA
jgi:hypothetical protein